jgi:SAM-dependent methyltransferase
VIGVDPDPAVHENPSLDEALVAHPNAPLPLTDASTDMIVSYAVLEHVEDPPALAAEVCRVLRPGGWFCAWTPNKWGYVGIGARCVPNSLHRDLGEDRIEA